MPSTPDPSLMATFCQEVEQQVAVLNASLLALESPSTPMAESLESLMRAAHSLKGAARMVNLSAVVALTHHLESCFVASQRGSLTLTPPDLDLLFEVVDCLAALGRTPPLEVESWLEGQGSTLDRLHHHLQTLLASVDPGAAMEPPSGLPAVASAVPTGLMSQGVQSQALTTADAGPLPPDRVVRVSAENLHRIMSLAGESLVDANGLQPFADSLGAVKGAHQELAKLLEHLEQELNQGLDSLPQPSVSHLKTLIQAARHQERHCYDLLDDRLGELELYVRRSLNLSDRLYREVIHAHMRPFSDGIEGFPRMVRDLSRQMEKQVQFDIVGKATLVDRDILNKLEAPLTHILRNAVDHGIETVADRLAQGKPPQGTVRLEALHRGGMLVISISDDGRGIDLDALRQGVLNQGRVSPDMAHRLTETELLDFLFLPGFSTAPQVTELSGRGVGLDVAKTMAQAVGGRLQVTSQRNQGTRFSFQLPLTLSVVRALLVQIGGEPYAFPLARVDQIVHVNPGDVYWAEGRQFFSKDHQNIGLIPAHGILDVKPQPQSAGTMAVVVMRERGHTYGLVVEQFLGEEDLVVRPLDTRLGPIRDISAAAILRDGSPVLIVDVGDLVHSIDQYLRKGHWLSVDWEAHPSPQQGYCILLVDDSPTVRETQRRILVGQGYSVNQAANGLEAWESLLQQPYDLLITDVDMPGLTGVELVRQVRSHPRLQQVPVIMVSYRDRPEDQTQGLEAGANVYLTKSSFQDESFIQTVRRLLSQTTPAPRV
ncbi:hybrid sensor histidine kinase/response regulator [Prochlorothrix hollandica]|uniref:histidine kinase n=1 Tax=Prochlorothrix hollandica PCC 9006 = CALU 1027 TaxID=317619 RepID=A0A0M2PXQ3_PROHO|nr:hybrid sensor histidine kinase/response regulator [Prochlorothrix hollandica]KKI99448.1 chemotaxis protein CheA [Prochlorothrix hollandica PCC 9006 = CALU 1027]